MKKEKERVRSVRSDKKININPTIPVSLKKCLYRISVLTHQPVKDIGVYVCKEGLSSKTSIELLSQYFRREYWFGDTLFIGNLTQESLQRARLSNETERITLRFTSDVCEQIKELAYSLDVTPSKATALLIDVTIRHTNFISRYMKEHVTSDLDSIQVKQLREMLAYMNKIMPSVVTWGAFISYLFGEVKDNKVFVSQKIYDLIKEYEH